MPDTDDVKDLMHRLPIVESQAGRHEERLAGHDRELGEVKDLAEKTGQKIDGINTTIGTIEKNQVAMGGKIDQLLEFRQDAKGAVISVAQKLLLVIGGILTLLALSILVIIEFVKT